MTIVSVKLFETAILEWCLPHEEGANAEPSSVDDRSSDITRPENLPRSFSIQQATMANVGMPCMIVVSVEISDTAVLEGCLLHEKDAKAGPRPSMTGHRITRPENLPSSFSIQKATLATVAPACRFMHNVAKMSHMGETGATDALTFLGPRRNKRHSIQ
jgi:hypothetical protein